MDQNNNTEGKLSTSPPLRPGAPSPSSIARMAAQDRLTSNEDSVNAIYHHQQQQQQQHFYQQQQQQNLQRPPTATPSHLNSPPQNLQMFYAQQNFPISNQLPPIPLGAERRMTFFRLGQFDVMRTLGTGTFGRVFLVRYRGRCKYFALKKQRKVDVYRLKQVDHVHNERSLLARLNHPFIIRLYAAMQDERHLYMLMEYAPGGELFHYLRKAGRFDVATARFYAAELVLALEYMHIYGIAYRDLKPENLLLDSDGHLKLADFGFAKLVPDLTWTLCGTPEYLAPEIIHGKGYGRSVDWWALGVLIYEMMVGAPPFNGDNPTAVYEKIFNGTVSYPTSILAPPSIELISGLLTLDVAHRWGCGSVGVAMIKKAAFFSGIDWALLEARAYRAPILPQPEKEEDMNLALNFPVDDCKSSMDVYIEEEDEILKHCGHNFSAFTAA